MHLTALAVQLYVPPDTMINKDFLKDIFAERKLLMPLQQLKVVVVPKYDEISVKSIYPQV